MEDRGDRGLFGGEREKLRNAAQEVLALKDESYVTSELAFHQMKQLGAAARIAEVVDEETEGRIHPEPQEILWFASHIQIAAGHLIEVIATDSLDPFHYPPYLPMVAVGFAGDPKPSADYDIWTVDTEAAAKFAYQRIVGVDFDSNEVRYERILDEIGRALSRERLITPPNEATPVDAEELNSRIPGFSHGLAGELSPLVHFTLNEPAFAGTVLTPVGKEYHVERLIYQGKAIHTGNQEKDKNALRELLRFEQKMVLTQALRSKQLVMAYPETDRSMRISSNLYGRLSKEGELKRLKYQRQLAFEFVLPFVSSATSNDAEKVLTGARVMAARNKDSATSILENLDRVGGGSFFAKRTRARQQERLQQVAFVNKLLHTQESWLLKEIERELQKRNAQR
ncbi:MAG: hypothetical protein KDD70_05225 [Bdellovibrionales bacterium]|nr:hypothetical protein [Bdellovibrionales bacterium]